MSTPIPDLPSPPKAARIKRDETFTMASTGFQSAPHTSGNHLKSRGRPRAMHDISQKPSESPEDSIFTYFQKEAEKKEDASCVFLLWGSENSETSTTWAVDVPITDLEGEDKVFASMAERYVTECGFLRRYLFFRSFSRLRPVTFRLICRCSNRFLVFMEPVDLTICQKNYSEWLAKEEDLIASITSPDIIDCADNCYRNSSGLYVHCHQYCPIEAHSDFYPVVCPFEECDKCHDQLRWIKTVPFFSCYFRNPVGARSQNILNGSNDYRFVQLYRDIRLLPNSFQPQNRYMELKGLYVETVWSITRCIAVFAVLLLSVVAGGKVIWGSWEIVFGAGSFFVALPMLALTVLSYNES